MPIRLSAAAQFDLFQIALEGLDRFGPAQVDAYEAGLQNAFDLLVLNPRMAPEHPEFDPPLRIHPFRAHIIIYRVEDDDLFVVRVCHSREDWTRFA